MTDDEMLKELERLKTLSDVQQLESDPPRRGFAAMDRDKQRELASQGGKKAHALGHAHKWTKETARAAGRKGGEVSGYKKRKGPVGHE